MYDILHDSPWHQRRHLCVQPLQNCLGDSYTVLELGLLDPSVYSQESIG